MTDPPEPADDPGSFGGEASARAWLGLVAVGIAAGFFSGLFGIGGGMVVVPALVAFLGMQHHRAIGTSLLAIVPAVLAGVVSYAAAGSVDWLAAVAVAVGAVAGAWIGNLLLPRIPRRVAQWTFVAFVLVMAISLFVVVPDRGTVPAWDAWRLAGLVVLGLVAGALASILGIGGGGVIVPVLMLAFGMSDLDAKGTSLAMLVPGVMTGLVGNLRRRNVDVRAGLVIGVVAFLVTPLGAWVAHLVSAEAGSILFGCFLLVIAATMIHQATRPERRLP